MGADLVAGGRDPRQTPDYAIAAWLDAKTKRSGSAKTHRAYQDTLGSLRVALQTLGLDLDSDTAKIADVIQVWASHGGKEHVPVANSTYNQRLAIISSFYAFALRRRMLLVSNPVDLLDRRPEEAYHGAVALDAVSLRRRLDAIDRTTPMGMRDYALLAVALSTGRRLSEIADMTHGGLEDRGDTFLVSFRAKGGKTLLDVLPPPVTRHLREWLMAAASLLPGSSAVTVYSGKPGEDHTPVWISLSRHDFGQKLTARSLSRIMKSRTGVSKFHATRHTFAHEMEAAGASVGDIQRRLGHSDLKVTTRYLDRLRSAENAYSDKLSEVFGF